MVKKFIVCLKWIKTHQSLVYFVCHPCGETICKHHVNEQEIEKFVSHKAKIIKFR